MENNTTNQEETTAADLARGWIEEEPLLGEVPFQLPEGVAKLFAKRRKKGSRPDASRRLKQYHQKRKSAVARVSELEAENKALKEEIEKLKKGQNDKS